MSRRKATASEQLAGHREEIREAEQRVGECELALSSAIRRAETAGEGLSIYFEEVEAGERQASTAEEKRRSAEARKAREDAEVEIVRARAAVRGAGRMLDVKRNAEQRFAAGHRAELIEELSERSEAARDRLLAAVEDFRSAQGTWSTLRSEWERLLGRWGISPAELPATPFAGAWQQIDRDLAPLAGGIKRDPRRLVPMPESLVPGDWSEFEPDGEEDLAA